MSTAYYPKLYCVECGGLVSDLVCVSCNRTYRTIDGIPCLLSRKDEESELFQRYLENYSSIAKDDIAEDIMPAYYKEAQADKTINYYGKIGKKTVLDIGAGKGLLLRRVPHNNKVAVDISTEYLSLLKGEGISVIMANAERLPFVEEFDLIFLTDVLEHVLHPYEVLQSLRRALKVGGKAIIRVPYREDLSAYSHESGCKYEFVHLRSFDEVVLAEIIEDKGLRLKRFHYDGFSANRKRQERVQPFTIFLVSILSLTFQRKFNKVEIHPLIWHLPKWFSSTFFNMRVLSLLWRGQLSTTEIEPHICRFPNWFGSMFFYPYEIVAVVERPKNKTSE